MCNIIVPDIISNENVLQVHKLCRDIIVVKVILIVQVEVILVDTMLGLLLMTFLHQLLCWLRLYLLCRS